MHLAIRLHNNSEFDTAVLLQQLISDIRGPAGWQAEFQRIFAGLTRPVNQAHFVTL